MDNAGQTIVTDQSVKTSKKRAGFRKVLVAVILLASLFFILDRTNIISFTSSFPFIHFGFIENFAVIGHVGKESIYQKDLDTELSMYPPIKGVDRLKLLREKIAKDSIILQAAQADKLIKLDETVFNSPKKDYGKRIKLVAEVQKKFANSMDSISGDVIAIWFYDGAPGSIGYEQGKAVAFKKVTELHDKVASNKMTVQDATDAIKSDTSLSQVDLAYKANAHFSFTKGSKDMIVFDPGFTYVIRSLRKGEVSKVYLLKDKVREKGVPTGEMIDAVYMFAKVSDKKESDKPGFDDWYTQKSKNYEIKYK